MSNQRQTFRKIGITNNVSSTSQPAINLLANASLASSYNLTLPSTVPTIAGQSLISDTAGNLSWGSATATVSTFTGTTNPLTTATAVTGLLFTAASSQTTVYVAIQATTNIYSLYNVRVYQKGSTTNWGIAYDVSCDTDDVDPQVIFTVTSTGQIQYTLPTTLSGFTSITMMWTLGTSVSNTLTSLALSSTLNVAGLSTFTSAMQATSLALSSTLSVGGLATHAAMSGLSLALANAASSGSISSTVGSFLSLQSQTYTDTLTAASSTAAGNFSGTYFGIPTLAATNTAVTTATASTVTIAGPPTAGSNETIGTGYALNILNGNVNFAANLLLPTLNGRSTTPSSVVYQYASAASLSTSLNGGFTYSSNAPFTLYKSKGTDAAALLQSNGTFIAQTKGLYFIQWTGNNSSGNSYFVNPYVTTYGLTQTAASNISFMPGYFVATANNPWTTFLSLPLAVGDSFLLCAASSGSIQNMSLVINCVPLGAF